MDIADGRPPFAQMPQPERGFKVSDWRPKRIDRPPASTKRPSRSRREANIVAKVQISDGKDLDVNAIDGLTGGDGNNRIPATLARPADFLKTDRRSVPDSLFEESTADLGNDVLPKESVTSAEFHQREVRKLWPKVWQMACRENEIPDVGDRIAYDIVGQSIMIVRVAEDRIKAYHNTCQHRGTRLLKACDNSRQITCPFHAWTWNLDGSIKNIPARWDFPDVSDETVALREVRCETWNSFVFINFDPDSPSLEEYIGPTLLRHWEAWPRHRDRKVYHFGKIVPCNWKLALYAFNEVYHTVGAHPQSLNFAADCNTQYDFFGLHSRFFMTLGVPSGHVADIADPQDTISTFLSCYAPDRADDCPQIEGLDQSRAIMSDFMRENLRLMTGVDLTEKSDTEMLDGIGYNFFPNMIHWGGFALPVLHRFRPNGNDHRSCLWEVMYLASIPEGAELERDVPMRMLEAEELFAETPELGFLGHVLDQDVEALTLAQLGADSIGFDGPRFANYQERNLRNFERNLAKMVADDDDRT